MLYNSLFQCASRLFPLSENDLERNIELCKALSMKEKSLSKTNWCSQAEACDAVLATLESVTKTVEHFADDDYRELRPTEQL